MGGDYFVLRRWAGLLLGGIRQRPRIAPLSTGLCIWLTGSMGGHFLAFPILEQSCRQSLMRSPPLLVRRVSGSECNVHPSTYSIGHKGLKSIMKTSPTDAENGIRLS